MNLFIGHLIAHGLNVCSSENIMMHTRARNGTEVAWDPLILQDVLSHRTLLMAAAMAFSIAADNHTFTSGSCKRCLPRCCI